MNLPMAEHPRLRTARKLETEISELAGHLAAATCRFLLLIAEFDHLDGWVGHRSCAQWLSWRCALSPSAAREHVRIGHALHKFTLIREAFAAGRLSYSKVRAITRVADHHNEAELVQTALVTTAAQLERIVRGMRRATRSQITERHHRRTVSWHWGEDGMLVLHARLDPDEGALTIAALTAAQAAEPSPPRPTTAAGAREATTTTNPPEDTATDAREHTSAETGPDGAAETDPGAITETRGDPTAETREHATADARRDASAETREAPHTPARRLADTAEECGDPADPSATRADAFSAIMTSYLGSGAQDATDAEAFHVIVLTNASTLTTEDAEHAKDADPTTPGEAATAASRDADQADAGDDQRDRPGGVTEQGTALPRDTVLRLACTAAVTPARISEDGTPMDIGRKTRKLTAPLRRALRLRDSGSCRYPGCTARRRLHAHHIRHWADGGPTTLSNLISLCPAHHWAVHEGGHRLRVDDTRRLSVVRPDGRILVSAPSIGPGDASLVTANEHITANTIGPGWDGTPVDLGNAVLALLQPALADDGRDRDPGSGQSAA
jgi:Domain of unknown function (DUF222)/HNH endonuclease